MSFLAFSEPIEAVVEVGRLIFDSENLPLRSPNVDLERQRPFVVVVVGFDRDLSDQLELSPIDW